MSKYRTFQAEELCVIDALLELDTPDGVSDQDIQDAIGRSPVLEAIDWLAETGHIVPIRRNVSRAPAHVKTNESAARYWRATKTSAEKAARERKMVLAELERIISKCGVADEAERLRELLAMIREAGAAPAQTPEEDTSLPEGSGHEREAPARPARRGKPTTPEAAPAKPKRAGRVAR